MFKNLIFSVLIILGFISCAYGKLNHTINLTINYDITNYGAKRAYLSSHIADVPILDEKLWGKGSGGKYKKTVKHPGLSSPPNYALIDVFSVGKFPICATQFSKIRKDWYEYKSFTLTMNGYMDDSGPDYHTFKCKLDESN